MTMVTFQKAEISKALPEHGWELVDRSDGEEWWVDEVWVLRSKWSPTAAMAVLTFLVDQLHEGPRRRSEAVWAVACSRERLSDWTEATNASLIQISPAWQREQPKLWRQLADLRPG